MKEAGAQWLTALYDKLPSENATVLNGFKNVSVVEVVQKARDGTISDEEDLLPNDSMLEDAPFTVIEQS